MERSLQAVLQDHPVTACGEFCAEMVTFVCLKSRLLSNEAIATCRSQEFFRDIEVPTDHAVVSHLPKC